jgi:hypothetical protein
MGDNKVVFIFTDEANLEWVLANRSWSYDKYWVVLQRVEEDVPFSSLSLNKIDIWVYIHDLPIRRMIEETGTN